MLKTVSSFVNVIGALNYKGTWNASTNTPALASGVGTKGDYYVVSVAGSTNLDGVTLWGVGDWAAFNGTVWQKVDGGDTGNFTSVTVTGLTASKPVFTDANKALTSSGTLGADQGGTGLTTYATGDLPYATAATTISKLTIGGANAVLTSSGTAPQWSTSLTITTLNTSGQVLSTRGTSSSSPIYNWTDTGGANNSYLSFFNASDAWLYARSKNGSGAIRPVRFSINDYGDSTTGVQLWIENNGSVCAGLTAPATTATGGFLYVPACAGTPIGTPTAQTGYAPIVVDSTNNKLYFYSGGAWRDAGP